MQQYIAAFDVGTTAVKGVLADLESRAVLVRSVDIPTLTQGGVQEQEPAAWWEAFRSISREFTAAVAARDILGVVMSGQMQDLILLDDALDPLCPAILYSDGRAAKEAERLEAAFGAERFLSVTGNRCDGSLPLPKLMWVKEHRPALYEKTAHVLISSKDYLIARLTGACCGDVTACATAGAMDIREKSWSAGLLAAAGVDAALFPPLFASHRQVGAVKDGTDCGYAPGTPVFAGVGDAGATTLASGIARPGQYNVNLGTSGWVATVSDAPLTSEAGVFNLAAPTEGCYINVVPFLNAGNVHKWIAGVLADGDYDALSALLGRSSPGSGGVLFLPYLVGERFPVLDPDARGAFVGLTPQTSPADLARACLTGVACSIRQGMEKLESAPETISLIGGGARESVWRQVLADVLGKPVSVFRGSEHLPSLAVASMALRGLGRIGSYTAFTDSLTADADVYRPDPARREDCERLYRRYLRLYPALRALSGDDGIHASVD